MGFNIVMKLKIGDKAPDFTLASTTKSDFNLYHRQLGKPTVLYFYPKDFTYGCTTEACSFRDNFEEFTNLDIDVYGISMDSVRSHMDFKSQHNLPFELLSDPKGEVISLYNAKIPLFNITQRITYLLDKDLVIRYIYSNMLGFRGHIQQMLKNSKEFAH